MTIHYHPEVVQGSEEWAKMRVGLLTASELHLVITPTLKIADNDKIRGHIYELLAQRITGYVEPGYVSDAMLRGVEDEWRARELYNEKYGTVTEVGFVTNDMWGYTLGYSPDGIVGEDGLIECKSRMQKLQIKTIVEDEVPSENVIQLQAGMLVTGRSWCDYLSYSAGLPMFKKRVFADKAIQDAIIQAAGDFEEKLAQKLAVYRSVETKYFPTERKLDEEIVV